MMRPVVQRHAMDRRRWSGQIDSTDLVSPVPVDLHAAKCSSTSKLHSAVNAAPRTERERSRDSMLSLRVICGCVLASAAEAQW